MPRPKRRAGRIRRDGDVTGLAGQSGKAVHECYRGPVLLNPSLEPHPSNQPPNHPTTQPEAERMHANHRHARGKWPLGRRPSLARFRLPTWPILKLVHFWKAALLWHPTRFQSFAATALARKLSPKAWKSCKPLATCVACLLVTPSTLLAVQPSTPPASPCPTRP